MQEWAINSSEIVTDRSVLMEDAGEIGQVSLFTLTSFTLRQTRLQWVHIISMEEHKGRKSEYGIGES